VSQAITAFTRIANEFTNALAPLAWGRIGDCYFQWAGQDPAQAGERYKRALESYGMVFDSPLADVADVAARSQAEVGVGNICLKNAAVKPSAERKEWVKAALQHYMNVVTKGNLRPGETFDPKWMYEAGIKAARLCENEEQWEQATKIYEQLAAFLPPLRAALEKKITVAQTHVENRE
jgi:hypothetical protein